MAQRSFKLPIELDDALVREANRQGRTVSNLIVRALEQTLAGQGSGDTSSVISPRGSGSAKRTAPTEPPVSARALVDREAFTTGGKELEFAPSGHTRMEGVGTPLPKIAPRRQAK